MFHLKHDVKIQIKNEKEVFRFEYSMCLAYVPCVSFKLCPFSLTGNFFKAFNRHTHFGTG